VAASAGMARVRVSSQPAVMIVSTGDELIEPGDAIADYQVRRSNAYAVAATFAQAAAWSASATIMCPMMKRCCANVWLCI